MTNEIRFAHNPTAGIFGYPLKTHRKLGSGKPDHFGNETVHRWDSLVSVRKFGSFPNRLASVRIVTGDAPHIHQLEQVTPLVLDGFVLEHLGSPS